MALGATVLCLLLGFPMAYGIARSGPAVRSLLLLLIVLPLTLLASGPRLPKRLKLSGSRYCSTSSFGSG